MSENITLLRGTLTEPTAKTYYSNQQGGHETRLDDVTL